MAFVLRNSEARVNEIGWIFPAFKRGKIHPMSLASNKERNQSVPILLSFVHGRRSLMVAPI